MKSKFPSRKYSAVLFRRTLQCNKNLLLPFFLTALLLAGGCTPDETPVIIATAEITGITTDSATGGGIIVYGQEAQITGKGLVWDKKHDPTITRNAGKTLDETGENKFSHAIGGLTPSTTYYVRAYAVSSSGVSYGDEHVFKTYNDIVADADKNEYFTIVAGRQEWMSRNLITGRYANGDIIPNTKDHDIWSSLISGSWAWYNNDEKIHADYGKLYNWYAVVDERGLCPDGWRVPGENDWQELEEFLGISPETLSLVGLRGKYAGGKLKKTGTSHWLDPNAIATNEIGFSILPGGYRSSSGLFLLMGRNSNTWTSTSHDDGTAWFRNLFYNNAGIYRHVYSKNNGLSVRCIKD